MPLEGSETHHLHERKCSKCVRRRARRAQAKGDNKSQQPLAHPVSDYCSNISMPGHQ